MYHAKAHDFSPHSDGIITEEHIRAVFDFIVGERDHKDQIAWFKLESALIEGLRFSNEYLRAYLKVGSGLRVFA